MGFAFFGDFGVKLHGPIKTNNPSCGAKKVSIPCDRQITRPFNFSSASLF